MKWAKRMANRSSVIGELFTFFWKNKLWWLIPMLSVLVVFGLLLLFAQTSPIAPFIYTLF